MDPLARVHVACYTLHIAHFNDLDVLVNLTLTFWYIWIEAEFDAELNP